MSTHYARCTGSLHAAVTYAEIALRIALQECRSPQRLRENMRLLHREMRTTLFEQASRDAASICPERRHAA